MSETKKKQERQYVLALGMMYPELSIEKFKEAPGTTSSPKRDLLRLRALRTLMRMQPVGLSHGGERKWLHPRWNVQADLGDRAVGVVETVAVRDLQNATKKRAYRWIFGDYVRFPATYLVSFYRLVVERLLPAMLSAKLIDAHTGIVLPNPAKAYADGVFDKLPPTLVVAGYLHAKDNPLFQASESVPASAFGKSSNCDYVYGNSATGTTSALDPDRPFALIRMRETRPERT